MTSSDYPKVRIVNDKLAARFSRIELDGEDISRWVAHYEVVGNIRDVTLLRLDIMVGNLEIEAPMDGELMLSDAAQAFLIKNGWTAPGKPETLNEARERRGLPKFDFPGADQVVMVSADGPTLFHQDTPS